MPWAGGDQILRSRRQAPRYERDPSGEELTLLNLIVFAYKLPSAQGQKLIASMPVWTNGAFFDVEARTENRKVPNDEMRLFMQWLLAERFHMVAPPGWLLRAKRQNQRQLTHTAMQNPATRISRDVRQPNSTPFIPGKSTSRIATSVRVN